MVVAALGDVRLAGDNERRKDAAEGVNPGVHNLGLGARSDELDEVCKRIEVAASRGGRREGTREGRDLGELWARLRGGVGLLGGPLLVFLGRGWGHEERCVVGGRGRIASTVSRLSRNFREEKAVGDGKCARQQSRLCPFPLFIN